MGPTTAADTRQHVLFFNLELQGKQQALQNVLNRCAEVVKMGIRPWVRMQL